MAKEKHKRKSFFLLKVSPTQRTAMRFFCFVPVHVLAVLFLLPRALSTALCSCVVLCFAVVFLVFLCFTVVAFLCFTVVAFCFCLLARSCFLRVAPVPCPVRIVPNTFLCRLCFTVVAFCLAFSLPLICGVPCPLPASQLRLPLPLWLLFWLSMEKVKPGGPTH